VRSVNVSIQVYVIRANQSIREVEASSSRKPWVHFIFFVWANLIIRCRVQFTGSSSRVAKPSVPFGGWYRGQEGSMWSAVCSSVPHLQFAEGTKPHLCIVERNSPTAVRRRFSLTQEGLSRVIPGGEGPGDGINVWRREIFFCDSVFHLLSAQKVAVVLDLSRSVIVPAQPVQKGASIWVLAVV